MTFAKELLGALISAASVSAGFLTTALSILLPMASTPTGAKLRKSGYSLDLFRYMRSAIYWSMSVAAVSVVAFFSLTEPTGVNKQISTVLIFAATYAAMALVRVADILMSIFERATEPEDKGG